MRLPTIADVASFLATLGKAWSSSAAHALPGDRASGGGPLAVAALLGVAGAGSGAPSTTSSGGTSGAPGAVLPSAALHVLLVWRALLGQNLIIPSSLVLAVLVPPG